ncbi:MAG TPA: PQQ-binding-like beta-propeller repeat protein [Acidimicrobiales bacterium]|nr:PQQ-binding-like beta-propeller repeat protein [Acidimicrobiales bacterium]
MTRRTAALVAVLACLLAGCRSGPQTGGAPPPPPTTAVEDDGVTWDWTAPANASVGMPAADDREVAFTYGHQHLVLLDADGRELWQAARLGLRDVAPRLAGELVLAATDDGMAAFRRADGSKAWDATLAARANTPVVSGSVAVTSTWEGHLVGLGLADGKVVWKSDLPGGAIAPAAGDGSTAVAVWQRQDQRAAGAVAVDGATGRRRWAVALEPGGVGGPAVTPDGAVVMVAGDLAAHALALADGKERWRTELAGAGSPEVPPAVVDDGSVLVAHRLGGLDLLDSATGRRLWQTDADGIAVRGGPVVGPRGSFAFPLDDGRLMLAGPGRNVELRQAPGRISGLATGPRGLLVAATRGSAQNAVGATPKW